MLTWAQKTGRSKKIPWSTPERGRGFMPPRKGVHFSPFPYSGRWRTQLHGFGEVIPGMAKSHPGMLPSEIRAKQEALIKAQQLENEEQDKSRALLRESELAKKQAQIWEAEEKATREKILAAEPKFEYLTLDKSHQMDVVKDRLSKGWEINTQDEGWIILQKRLSGLEGLGKSFFKKIFSKPSELKKHLKSSAPTPKKIKARMKTGLKLMKVALKPSGAKLLAKKGGMKAAMTNPDQFFATYQAKKAAKQQAQQEAEQPSVQPAETYEVEGKVYTREEFIAAFGMTPEQYESGESPSVPPVEAQPQPIYTDDPNMPSLPPQPVPTATEPAPSADYPAEEYYPDESAAMDYTMYPEDYTPVEEPYYQGYDMAQKSEVIKGTEWYYDQPFDTERIDYMQEDQPVEYEGFQSEAINPNADWYRSMKEYPHTEEETDYIPPVSFRKDYQPEYSSGGVKSQPVSFRDKDTLSGYDIYVPRGKRKKYFPEGYMPMRPQPVSPAFTRLTKTYKYEPDEITNIPVPVSRPVKLGWQRKGGF